MKIRKQTKIWVTRDGRKIRICDMSDGHLKNTIKMFYRSYRCYLSNCQAQLYGYLSSDPPDGAYMCAEMELANMEHLLYDGYSREEWCGDTPDLKERVEAEYPILVNMALEQNRRNQLSVGERRRETKERFKINSKLKPNKSDRQEQLEDAYAEYLVTDWGDRD